MTQHQEPSRVVFDCMVYLQATANVRTVQELGFGNKRVNERDIAKDKVEVAGKFDVYLTTESNNRNTFQKDIGKLSQYRDQYPIGFMILKTEKGKHPTYENLKPMMPNIQLALENMRSGILLED